MNKVFKVVWNKAKCCYVVASELAKRRTKAPKSGVINHAVVASILATVLSFGAVLPSFVSAEECVQAPIHNWKTETIIEFHRIHDTVSNTYYSNIELPDDAIFVYNNGDRNNGTLYLNGSAEFTKYKSLINKIDSASQWLGQYSYQDGDYSVYTSLYGFGTSNGFGTYDTQFGRYYIPGSVTLSNVDALTESVANGSGSISYTAGNGITISNETISAKAGTNVTVNSNGISVTGNGTVASGNTGLIDGGKLYAEVRPSDNGNYVKYKNSI